MSGEVLLNGEEPDNVKEAYLNRDLTAAGDSMPHEWKCAIVGQVLGRRFLLNKRCQSKGTIAKLATLVAEVRDSRDLAALMEGVQVSSESCRARKNSRL